LATYNGSGLTNPVTFLNSNNYANGGRWTLGGSYSHKVSDKLALTGAVQYVADTNYELAGKPSAWKVGGVVDYTIVPGFAAKLAVTYAKPSGAKGSTGGFLRFQRSF
jgi:long-subunit fatty acid transport protein